MRNVFLAITLLATNACAQTAAPAPAPASTSQSGVPSLRSGWDQVHFVPIGTALHVKTMTNQKVDCVFISATGDSLNCGGITFQQPNIQSIKIAHRLRSTFVGLGIGYGTAVAITAVAVSKSNSCGYFGCNDRCSSIGCAASVVAVNLGLVIASPIVGHITDFTAHTIYKAN